MDTLTNLNLRQMLEGMPFIFTSTYQKRALQLKVDDYEATFARIRRWAVIGLVALLCLLLGTTFFNI